MTIGILNRDLEVDMSGSDMAEEGLSYVAPPEKDEEGRLIATAVQTIQATPDQLYSLWSDISSFPMWQENVISVIPDGPALSHWVMGNPEDVDGRRLEFDSQIVEDIPGRRIAWKSITKEVDLAGSVTFQEANSGRGTVVNLRQALKVPLGDFANSLTAAVKRSPRQTLAENLRHFKQLVETGEIPSVMGQPHGPRGLSGGIKQWLYGETNPTPHGTSEAE